MKIVKISSKLFAKFNELESFLDENFIDAFDEEGFYDTRPLPDPERASDILSKFEKLCDEYHKLISVEAKANGVVDQVIENYFNSMSCCEEDIAVWKGFIKDYSFEVEGLN